MPHFEDLWEEGEKLHSNDEASLASVLEELALKVSLYKIAEGRQDIPSDELQKLKSRTIGEILLVLTHLSVKDNINVYDALKTAIQYRSSEIFAKIPKELKLPGRK